MYDTSSLDVLAGTYTDALVTTLKNKDDLTSPLLEDAFRNVPRHPFIEQFYRCDIRDRRVEWQRMDQASVRDKEAWLQAIYANNPLVTAFDATGNPTSSSSSPGAMALMLEALQPRPGLRILEIGTGTGYNAALLARIVGDPHLVFSVEINAELARRAQEKLDQVAGAGITIYAGNGLNGYEPGAPYDRIIATGSYHKVPFAWLDQLRTGGIIMMNLRRPLGSSAFLKIQKMGSQRAAHGVFLQGSDFMDLQDANYPLFTVPTLVSEYLSRVVTAQIPFSHNEFDPSLLWDHKMNFALQLVFPQMYFFSIQANPMLPCLVDVTSDTMLVFHPAEPDDSWVVEVRGEPRIWEKVSQTYQLWMNAGQPDISEYVLEIDDMGKQYAAFSRTNEGEVSPRWVLT